MFENIIALLSALCTTQYGCMSKRIDIFRDHSTTTDVGREQATETFYFVFTGTLWEYQT